MLNFFSYKDLPKNRTKKIIFLTTGFIILLICFILLRNIPRSLPDIRKLITALFLCSSILLILPVIFLSFLESVYVFKSKILQFLVPFLFTWLAIVLYIANDKSDFIVFLSLVISMAGLIFSGLRIISLSRFILYFDFLLNYISSRFSFSIFLLLNFANAFNFISKLIR